MLYIFPVKDMKNILDSSTHEPGLIITGGAASPQRNKQAYSPKTVSMKKASLAFALSMALLSGTSLTTIATALDIGDAGYEHSTVDTAMEAQMDADVARSNSSVADARHRVATEDTIHRRDLFTLVLAEWIQLLNKKTAEFDGLSPEAAGKLYASDKSSLSKGALINSSEYEMLKEACEPLLLRWDDANYMTKRMGAFDQTAFAALDKAGIIPTVETGHPSLDINRTWLDARISPRVDKDMQSFLKLRADQPDELFDDAMLVYTFEALGKWSVQWEDFLKTHPNGTAHAAAINEYLTFMRELMFCKASNSPTFFKQPLSKEKGVMSSDWEEGLVAVAKAHPGTKTAKLLEDYLRDLAKVKFVEDKAILDRYKKLLENSFK